MASVSPSINIAVVANFQICMTDKKYNQILTCYVANIYVVIDQIFHIGLL